MHLKAFGIAPYKIDKNGISILLCKSISSKNRWGFLKGGQEKNETDIQTALREFQEESSINIEEKYLEKYFEQENSDKDIGVFLISYNNIQNINKYFNNGTLEKKYLSWENSHVQFFSIENLPEIKKKQIELVRDIVHYLKKDKG